MLLIGLMMLLRRVEAFASFLCEPEIKRHRHDQILARHEHVFAADKLSDRAVTRHDQLAHYVLVAAQFEHDKAQIQIAAFSSILGGSVKKPYVYKTRLEHAHVIGLHFLSAFKSQIKNSINYSTIFVY